VARKPSVKFKFGGLSCVLLLGILRILDRKQACFNVYRQGMTFATQHEMRLFYAFGLKGTRWWAEYLEPIPESYQIAFSESNTDLACISGEFQSLPFC
jgi:hypothetical protein